MPMVRAMRLLSAVETGTLTGAELQTLLTNDPGRAGEWRVLTGMPGQMRRMAASSTTMTAVAASSIAMTAVAASSIAMTAVAASSIAKMVIFNSDAALTIISESAVALGAMRAAPTYEVFSSSAGAGNTARALSGTVSTASYIVLGASTSDTSVGATMTLSTRRTGSTRPNTILTTASNTGSTTASDTLVMPMVSPFTIISTDITNPQTGYVGALRCDV